MHDGPMKGRHRTGGWRRAGVCAALVAATVVPVTVAAATRPAPRRRCRSGRRPPTVPTRSRSSSPRNKTSRSARRRRRSTLPDGASDEAVTNYSYDDMPVGQTDPSLRHFSVSHDTSCIIPVLQQALSLNPNVKIDATPWSAPRLDEDGDTFTGDCSGTLNYLNPTYCTESSGSCPVMSPPDRA
jgi:Glycosyl hydrolase family 30 TIM-barrel domain